MVDSFGQRLLGRLKQSGSQILLTTSEGRFTGPELLSRAAALSETITDKRRIHYLGTGAWTIESVTLLLALLLQEKGQCPALLAAGDDRGPLAASLLSQIDLHSGTLLAITTSGTTGFPRIALHRLEKLVRAKWREKPDQDNSVLCVYPREHLAGLDILLRSLHGGRPIVVMDKPDPSLAARWIEKYRPAVLPCTPTFLRLMIHSGSCENRDLSSIQTVVYGAEAMSLPLRERLGMLLPRTRLLQSYGLTEAGVRSIQEKPAGQGWFRFPDDNSEARIINGSIHLKPSSLEALFQVDQSENRLCLLELDQGWLDTGDQVEQEGEWIRIISRRGRVINVGGEKIRPEDIENLVTSLSWISAARVSAMASPLTGSMVCLDAEMLPDSPFQGKDREAINLIRGLCLRSLSRFHVPQKIQFHPLGYLMGSRLKEASPDNPGPTKENEP